MNRLLYLSYGSGPHEQEVLFSLGTAQRWGTENWRATILTDHPGSFSQADADVEFVSPEQWDDWAGPTGFNHRRKILALKHVLTQAQEPVILLDGDTWIRQSITEAFHRIGPGRSLMHIREGSINEIDSPLMRSMTRFLEDNSFDVDSSTVSIPSTAQMWNAGVVGMHPDDSRLLDDVLSLTDQFCEKSNLHVLEQFAFSWLLSRQTKISESADIVFHYWPPYLHQPFRKRIAEIMKSANKLTGQERLEYLFSNRPRPTPARRVKVLLKRCGQWLGLIKGRCRSNEW